MSGLQGKVQSDEGIPLFNFVGVIQLFCYKTKSIFGREVNCVFHGECDSGWFWRSSISVGHLRKLFSQCFLSTSNPPMTRGLWTRVMSLV